MEQNSFDEAKRIVAEATRKLISTNPSERLEAMEMLDSYDAFLERFSAVPSVIQAYKKEEFSDVKYEMIKFLFQCSRAKPSRESFPLFKSAAADIDERVAMFGCLGLFSYNEGYELALQRLPELYEFEKSNMTKRWVLGYLGKFAPKTEPLIGMVVKELSNPSYLYRKAAAKAVKKMKKSGVNVVGYLVNELETGSVNQKVAACVGIGMLGKDATGSIHALISALNSDSTAVRGKAAWALWKMEKKASPAESALREALNDESPAVSKYALKALGKFKKLSKDQKKKIKDMENYEKDVKKLAKDYGIKQKKMPKERDDDKLPANSGAEPEVKNRFFMSHSSADFSWVLKVVREIEKWPGCKAWYCERDIYHGQDWMESIYDGIEQCNWFLLFWSENAQGSHWTMEEIREAKLRNVESENTNPKVSLLNLGMSEMPRLLTRQQGSKVDDDAGVQEFLARLKAQVDFERN